ncbi:predicted protein [Thalassiosira pseudonana CCMP1335]|uniref:RING-type E3 ubiquitin transferase n=1 Tax=Thalassiosira pseudonana TaxID=35128 RepID=B5YP41_THAPS|nr:predicted protein [Thalassiosira pseudonana CCMP1335]ACI64389.1 predicted protein [Thalassiosira pseudonana CCMP1335]
MNSSIDNDGVNSNNSNNRNDTNNRKRKAPGNTSHNSTMEEEANNTIFAMNNNDGDGHSTSSMEREHPNNDNLNSTNNDEGEPSPSSSLTHDVTLCPRCNHHVPTANIVVHDVNCGRTRNEERRAMQMHHQLDQFNQQREQPINNTLVHSLSSTNAVANNESANQSADVAIIGDTNDTTPPSPSSATATASFVGNIRPPLPPQSRPDSDTTAQSSVAARTTSQTPVSDDMINQNLHEEGQWSCPRCTLINQSGVGYCDACLLPRPGGSSLTLNVPSASGGVDSNDTDHRPPDRVRRSRLVAAPLEEGWVNVSRSSTDRGNGDNGTSTRSISSNTNNNTIANDNNSNNNAETPPTFQQRMTTTYRIFNGALNGAMIGSVFGGLPGLCMGGIAGAAGAALADRVRSRNEDIGRREMEQLLRDGNTYSGGGDSMGSYGGRMWMGGGTTGTNRVLRVRYGNNLNGNSQGRLDGRRTTTTRGNQPTRNGDAERELLEMLIRMSYANNNFAPTMGNNVLIQPEMSYEELLERFGLGNDNRGASEEVINSYPVEVVGDGDNEEGVECVLEKESKKLKSDDEATSMLSKPTDSKVDYGTCGICLEDYQKGELKKTLGCPNHPHAFHKGCIDQWLSRVASCPICKAEVGMYHHDSSCGAATTK